MKMIRQSKLTVSKSRWLAYATASAATAFGTAPQVEAEIHYSGHVDARIFSSHSFAFPLSNGAALTFNLVGVGSYPEAGVVLRGGVSASGRVYRTIDRGSTAFLSNLGRGHPVSSGNFSSIAGAPRRGLIHGLFGTGEFKESGNAIIGFKFNVGNGTQYGWVRIKVQKGNDSGKYGYAVKEYAWGDPGDSILTGQTSSAEATAHAVPRSGSLGLLALGSAGIEEWRAQRARAGE